MGLYGAFVSVTVAFLVLGIASCCLGSGLARINFWSRKDAGLCWTMVSMAVICMWTVYACAYLSQVHPFVSPVVIKGGEGR